MKSRFLTAGILSAALGLFAQAAAAQTEFLNVS